MKWTKLVWIVPDVSISWTFYGKLIGMEWMFSLQNAANINVTLNSLYYWHCDNFNGTIEFRCKIISFIITLKQWHCRNWMIILFKMILSRQHNMLLIEIAVQTKRWHLQLCDIIMYLVLRANWFGCTWIFFPIRLMICSAIVGYSFGFIEMRM